MENKVIRVPIEEEEYDLIEIYFPDCIEEIYVSIAPEVVGLITFSSLW